MSIADAVFDDLLSYGRQALRNPKGLRRYRGYSGSLNRATLAERFVSDVSFAYQRWQGLDWNDARAIEILEIADRLQEAR